MARLVPADEVTEKKQARLIPADTPAHAAPQGVSTLEGLQRGALDVGQGIKQLYLMATDPDAAKEYTAQVNREIADYEARRGANAGYDWARLGGNIGVQAPLMFIPGGQATLGARLVAGATAGALGGASQFSSEGTWTDKAVQTGAGATVGAIAPEAVRGGIKGVTAVGQTAKNAIVGRGTSAITSNADILSQVQQAGRAVDDTFDIGQLSKETQDRLVSGAREQLRATGQLDPQSLLRSQDYAAVGVTPTRGQITRDPRQWQTERNLAQVQGVGDDLLARFREQPQQLISYLENLRTGQAAAPIDAGRAAMEVIGSRTQRSGIYGEAGRKIDDIFSQARKAPGAEAVMDFDPFSTRIAQTLEEFEDKIPSPITKRLNQFSEGTDRPFSVAEAAKFRELLNARIREGDPGQAKALTQIKRELDDFMVSQADAVGDSGVEAIKLFQSAAKASAQRAQEFSARPLQEAVAGTVEPDDFFKRFVIGGKVGDLNQLKSLLNRADVSPELAARGSQAWNDLRGQTVQWIMNKAAPDGENFSQANYRKAIESLGPRLEVLFTPEERGMLFTLQRASQGLMADPATGGIPIVNRSGSAATAINLLNRMNLVPGLNVLTQPMAQALETQAGRSAASQALQPAFASTSARDALQQASRAALASTLVSPFGTQPIAVGAESAFMRERRPRRGLLD